MNTECECKEYHYVREKDDGKCYGMYLYSSLSTSYILGIPRIQYIENTYHLMQVCLLRFVTDSENSKLNLNFNLKSLPCICAGAKSMQPCFYLQGNGYKNFYRLI